MSENTLDTDTQLALLASLLPQPTPPQAALLDALVAAEGDVSRAAAAFHSQQQQSQSKSPLKRKRSADTASPSPSKRKGARGKLDAWLGGGASSSSSAPPPPPPRRSPSPSRFTIKSTSHPSLPSAFSLLQRTPQTPSTPTPPTSLPPLTLPSPALVAQHTPCTLHPHILPASLARELYTVMIEEAADWSRNRFWMFEREVESPHRTGFYVREGTEKERGPGVGDLKEAGKYFYNGVHTRARPFPPVLVRVADYLTPLVNEAIAARPTRFPLEYAGPWLPNVAAANCYDGGKEGVGWHADQLTYLGPACTIVSLSLGTTRQFRLRGPTGALPHTSLSSPSSSSSSTPEPRTYSIPLPHNSLLIMHAGTQESYKHCVPPQRSVDIFRLPSSPSPSLSPSNPSPATTTSPHPSTLHTERINLTFRFYRPDFRPSSTPRCKCGAPCLLRADLKRKHRPPDAGEGVAYMWQCAAGEESRGKGCGFFRILDWRGEGRGPVKGWANGEGGGG